MTNKDEDEEREIDRKVSLNPAPVRRPHQEDFVPYSKRKQENNRFKTDFDESSADGFFALIKNQVSESDISSSVKRVEEEHGTLPKTTKQELFKTKPATQAFIQRKEIFFDFLEILINERKPGLKTVRKIDRKFREESLLYRLRPDPSGNYQDLGIPKKASEPLKYINFRIEKIETEMMVESTDKSTYHFRNGWSDELEAHNRALKTVQKENNYSFKVMGDLYVSLEKVCKRICEETGYQKDNESMGGYLAHLMDEGYFDESKRMQQEINELSEFLQEFEEHIEHSAGKLGGDRKRHEVVSREYCMLTIHQTSAIINYLISTHKDN